MTTAETDEDWHDEVLVLTHECLPPQDAKGPRALPTVTLKPTPAADLWDTFSDDGNGWAALRADIKAVALHDGERTTFVDGLRYHVRRATRAERLGQEDRLHEDDEDRNLDGLAKEDLAEQLDEALDALAALMEWEAHMGGWDAPVWGRAHDILAKHGRN